MKIFTNKEIEKMTDLELASIIFDFTLNDCLLLKSEFGRDNYKRLSFEATQRFVLETFNK